MVVLVVVVIILSNILVVILVILIIVVVMVVLFLIALTLHFPRQRAECGHGPLLFLAPLFGQRRRLLGVHTQR
jgi:hypothetical protein